MHIWNKISLQFVYLAIKLISLSLTFIPLVEGNVRATECDLAYLHQQFISLRTRNWDIFVSIADSGLALYQSFHSCRQHFQVLDEVGSLADIHSLAALCKPYDHAPFLVLS